MYFVVLLNEVSGPVCFGAKSGQIDGRCLAGNFPIWMLLFYKCWLSHNILFEIEETLIREIQQKKIQTLNRSLLFMDTFEVAFMHIPGKTNFKFPPKIHKWECSYEMLPLNHVFVFYRLHEVFNLQQSSWLKSQRL